MKVYKQIVLKNLGEKKWGYIGASKVCQKCLSCRNFCYLYSYSIYCTMKSLIFIPAYYVNTLTSITLKKVSEEGKWLVFEMGPPSYV